ncbi:MAG TPA: PQQ-dependent sugar dehydrogenase [Verrucomicrobiae bacterium]|nr:PQQ-dependent sugar dehydrogenase [Verrucomicrobiae bacterium]
MNKIKFLPAVACCILTAVFTASAAQPLPPLPQIALKQVFPNLQIDRPVWMSEAPDGSGRLFFVAQAGKILIVKKGSDGGDAKEFLNIEDRHPYFDNEDGLMSIAFHPGFKTNGLFYIYYNQKNPADQHSQPQNYPFRSVISEFKVSTTDPDKADMSSERILFEVPQPFSNHKGGELAFGPDGYLYLGLGDGGNGGDPFGSGQSTSTLLAKMLRIDVNSRTTIGSGKRAHELNYGIPSDNPFVHEPDINSGARKEIFAYGLRNPWRYSWDKKTGDLWVGDVGQDLWEEVDVITNGGNYGWSVREGAHHFKPGPPGAQYIEPVMEYPHKPNLQPEALFPDHSIGLCVIGGYVYRGKKFPALEGVYVYGDYNLGTIWGLRYDRDAHKVTAHGTLLNQKKNIFSFAEDLDGELYVLTQDGQIYSIAVP